MILYKKLSCFLLFVLFLIVYLLPVDLQLFLYLLCSFVKYSLLITLFFPMHLQFVKSYFQLHRIFLLEKLASNDVPLFVITVFVYLLAFISAFQNLFYFFIHLLNIRYMICLYFKCILRLLRSG